MEHKIIIAGIGPGAKEYVIPAALQAIEEAKVLVGGSRALSEFSHQGQLCYPIKADIPGVLQFIEEQVKLHDVVVMVSGDPGYYSMLKSLRENFPVQQLQVIPGISSIQLAFAKVAVPWQTANLLSFHGRIPTDDELQYHEGKIIGMLTDKKFDSNTIAKYLLARKWPKQARAYVCSRLSYPDEMIAEMSLEEAQTLHNASHCVMIVAG